MTKRIKKDTERERIARELIRWFDGYGLDNPSDAEWASYTPLDQMRALKIADRVLELINKEKVNV